MLNPTNKEKIRLIKRWRNNDLQRSLDKEILSYFESYYTERIPKVDTLYRKYEGIGYKTAGKMQDVYIKALEDDLLAIEEEWIIEDTDDNRIFIQWDENAELFEFSIVPLAQILEWEDEDGEDDFEWIH